MSLFIQFQIFCLYNLGWRPNQDEYAIYAPKTFRVTNRATRVVDTHLEVTIPEGTHANVVAPPHGTFKTNDLSVKGHTILSGCKPLMVRLNNHGMTDRWINKGEIIGYLTLQKAPPQISCTEMKKLNPTMVSACQETASSGGGEGAPTSEISEHATSTVELITTHQAEQTDHPPLRGIPGVNMPIQYPRRRTREETPEERKKRRAENAAMCDKEHRP